MGAVTAAIVESCFAKDALSWRVAPIFDFGILGLFHAMSTSEHRAMYSYQAQRDDEITLSEGEVILVFESPESGWWRGAAGDKHGWFPGSYVEVGSVCGRTLW